MNLYAEGEIDKRVAPYSSDEDRLPPGVSRARRFDDPGCDHRGRFQLDRDRILYSGSFRKLQYKTQVFVTHEGDLYRTRMTHTIEVMQIARSIAGMLGLNEMLAEAIALVHDIGHPPFGHGGEETLKRLLADTGGFDHNLHGLRVVDLLERSYPSFKGLNLCWETREGLARHATVFDHPPLLEEFSSQPQPGPECQAVSAADTIAFCMHDLDDAMRIGMVKRDWLKEKAGKLRLIERLLEVMDAATAGPSWKLGHYSDDVARARGVSGLIGEMIVDVVEATRMKARSTGVRRVEDVRRLDSPLIDFSADMAGQVMELSEAMLDEVYTHPVVTRMLYKGERMLEGIYDAFVRSPRLLPHTLREDMEGEDARRAICDYLAGMTDRYAMDLYGMLYQPNERTTDWF